MATRTKKEDRKEVAEVLPGQGFSLQEFDHQDLDSVIEQLQSIRKAHTGEKLELRIDLDPYSDSKSYHVYRRRPETDDEMAARHAKEAQYRAQVEERDRQEFERLSKRFGPKG